MSSFVIILAVMAVFRSFLPFRLFAFGAVYYKGKVALYTQQTYVGVGLGLGLGVWLGL